MFSIMLLEDDPTMLSLLHTLLEIEGFKVSHTIDFENTLEAVREAKPDLVILDVNLREISGLDVLEGIKEDPQLKDIIVIMSSGMDMIEESRKKGADDFILKPYMPDELVRKIRSFLQE